MKTTLDLPDPLMRRVKIRAASEGRKLKDLVSDLIQRGLDTPVMPTLPQQAKVRKDVRRRIPVLASPPDAPATKMTAEELMALEREGLEHDDGRHAGLSL